ncbi:Zinc finger CCCH domain-containing protein 44 [Quillaja saponaria]|uniref:Zinc finger CCCH domain-containing protein 44 n=1 Tax=Quillaja saponaria TaxID=32244 RepID=A0AAD7PFK9_QUISA|nr:Zinc finger CCCH domain-containing protein 44 [Quillaja saponaria]
MEQSLNDFETEKVWHYQDPTEKIQGPFAMWQLRKWSTSGHFPPDLRIWPVNEKRDDSVLLTDALNGKCFKNVSLLFNNQLPTGVDFASDDRYISCDRGGNRRTNDIYTNSKSIEGRWNQNLDDPNVHCNSHEESVRSNGWDSYSTSWMGHSGIFEKSQDSSKCDISSHDKPQFCHSLPSTAFAGESHEALSDQVTEGYRMERYPDDSNEKQNSNKTSEGQSNNRQGYQKQPDSESHSDQSSGKNWSRPPGVNGSSSCLDSNSTFVSVTKGSQQQEIDFPDLPSPTPVSSSNCWDSTSAFVSVTKTSPQNQEIDFEELPPTPKPSNEKLESQLPEVAVEWRGYSPTSAKPSVEKWDPGLVSASSLKSTEILDDHAATPTSISGQLIHSSPSHLSCNPSSWQAIISEPNEFSSLGDESVSDLLAEVEAMESLVGLESPTSIMNCGEEFTEGPKNDCPISSEGLSPVPDPSKGDALSSTADIQPSQSTAKDEQQGSGLPSTVPSKATLDMAATDTKWRLESGSLNTTWGATKENESFSCSGLDQGNPNIGWGVGQGTIEENGGINSCTSIGNPGIQGNQTRYGSDRFYASRDRSSHGRDSGSGSGRTAWNRQPLFTVGNGGGSFRPLPKGQRICKFHESGYCKKGASCSYLHP